MSFKLASELKISETKFAEFRRINEILDSNYTYKEKLQKSNYLNTKLKQKLNEANELISKQRTDIQEREFFVRKKSKQMLNFVNEVSSVENDLKDEKWFLYARARELEEKLKLINFHVTKDRLLESKLGQMAELYGNQISLVMDCYEKLAFYVRDNLERIQEIFNVFHKINANFGETEDNKRKSEKLSINEFGQEKVISKKRSELNRFIIESKKMITKFECLKKLVGGYAIPEIIDDYKQKKQNYMEQLEKM